MNAKCFMGDRVTPREELYLHLKARLVEERIKFGPPVRVYSSRPLSPDDFIILITPGRYPSDGFDILKLV